MQRKFSLALAAILTCLVVVSPTFGQTMTKAKQAELAFEINLAQLRGTPLYELMSSNIERINGEMPGEVDIEKVNRIWGAVQFPDTVADMAAMENMQPGDDLPMDMFVHIEFADASSADAAMEEIAKQSKEVTIDGKTYFTPSDEADAPSNMYGRKINSTTMEFGTEDYLTVGAGEGVFSSGLGTAWGSFSDEPIRIAFDLENARELISEAVELGKADLPPMFGGMLDLFNKASDFRIAIDLKDGGNILKVSARGTNEDTAEDLRSGLDGMLAMAKMAGGGAVEKMRETDEAMADVVSAILRSLSAERDGDNVDITIPKPDGFEDAIKGMMEMNGMGGSDF